jgi:hypothetical protein
MEANGLYAIIHCWWLSLGVAFEAGVHELVNWLNFWHFHVKPWGGFMVHVSISRMNFLWLPLSFVNSKFEFHLHFISIWASIFVMTFQILLIFLFIWFVEVHLSTCNLAKTVHNIWLQQLKNATLVCTQRCQMITFELSNNLHCIDSVCKVVHLVMDMIGMIVVDEDLRVKWSY